MQTLPAILRDEDTKAYIVFFVGIVGLAGLVLAKVDSAMVTVIATAYGGLSTIFLGHDVLSGRFGQPPTSTLTQVATPAGSTTVATTTP